MAPSLVFRCGQKRNQGKEAERLPSGKKRTKVCAPRTTTLGRQRERSGGELFWLLFFAFLSLWQVFKPSFLPFPKNSKNNDEGSYFGESKNI
jgi:hypothetical protein